MTLHDRFLSYLRTYFPYLVGLVAAWALTTFAVQIPHELVLAVSAVVVVIAQNAYYMLIRFVETRIPWLGAFLGWPKQPEYIGTSNYWASVIRTGIPTLVGAAAGLLAAAGLRLDPETQNALAIALIGVAQAAYYSAARAIADRFPAWSWLLGDEPAPAAYFSTGD